MQQKFFQRVCSRKYVLYSIIIKSAKESRGWKVFLTNISYSRVAYGQKIAKCLHAGPKHQIWYMHRLRQYKHSWRGVPDFKGQDHGQVKVKLRLLPL